MLKHLGDEQVHQRARLFGGHVDGPDLALGFGADMPDLPGRPGLLHRRQHLVGGLRRPTPRRPLRWRSAVGGQCGRDHAATALRPPSTAAASVIQVAALLGQDAGFVFGVAGLQGGLLRQLQRFDRGGWPAVIGLELDGQFAAAER